MLKSLSIACAASLTFLCASFAQAGDLTGTWRTIDDKTGFSKALVEIKKDSTGAYHGTIVKIIPRPGYTPKETCQNCPAPYTNKPMVGLTVLNGLQQDPKNENNFINAKVLDPLSGNIYKGKAKLSADGRRLTMRGYVGISALGRSQTWIRED
ncbi:DUF2147 domain-containing protein [Alkanindiges illinoisensis]|uniref:DUF2147 domain-containing protein n=1 Tax=Alkanindiges illinoisensis TaxID=197183 RepID=A0A4Y7XFN8_9GAMM|nr:DUF2147 domain-containing protein [Alkanindiges illinoisensis]TEU30625.1 DUF2147 domain-containing protein [Alkanindiges illinoisensis]